MRLPPPRRVTDEALRSPIITSRPLPIGDAVAVYGLHQLAAVARRWVREYAGRPAEEAETLALLTTELFANAVRHSRSGKAGGEVIVIVSKTGMTTQVKVVDNGPCEPGAGPRLRDVDVAAGEGEDGGFGLRLVDAMSTRWGVLYEDSRTTVWFDIDRDQQ
ncbi:ATP-binding protein [Nocardiopsis sp. CA-288880]|uniref:ATP-binding protein n=1 Tax=Nocardiopsis sp. CA-288880 TaxID=3239995 RepID=UPI003D96ED2F